MESKKPHVLVCGPVHQEGMALLEHNEEITYEVIEDSTEELAKVVSKADGLVIRLALFSEELLAQCPNLKAVSRHGVGCDNVPVDNLTQRKIPVMVTGSANSLAVAEHALYLMFCVARQGVAMDKAVKEGNWLARRELPTFELAGRKLFIVGCGRIGKILVTKAVALGLKVSVYDPYLKQEQITELGASYVANLDDGLKVADIVSLHLPSMGDAIIKEEQFKQMSNDAVLINVSRGDLVDEVALENALKNGEIKAAGFDVLVTEPFDVNHPLLKLDNFVITPHSAALTEDSLKRMGIICVQNILDCLLDKPKKEFVINPQWEQN